MVNIQTKSNKIVYLLYLIKLIIEFSGFHILINDNVNVYLINYYIHLLNNL